MNKKRFRGENMQEALACVKSELGMDPMILSTRKIPKKPLDPYSKEMVEVEAAVKTGREKEEPQDKTNAVEVDLLKDELTEIKDLISLAGFGIGLPNMLENHFESVGVLASFLRCGVSERRAVALIERAAGSIPGDLDKGERLQLLKKKVMQQCLNQIRVKDV